MAGGRGLAFSWLGLSIISWSWGWGVGWEEADLLGRSGSWAMWSWFDHICCRKQGRRSVQPAKKCQVPAESHCGNLSRGGSALPLSGSCDQFLILQRMVTKGSLLWSGCEVSSYLGSCLARAPSHDPASVFISSSLSLESVTIKGSYVLIKGRPARVFGGH